MAWITGNQQQTSLRPNTLDILDEIEKIEGFLPEDQALYHLYRMMRSNITFTANLLMGVDLYPFQHMLIKNMMERDYTLHIVGRGGSKSIKISDHNYLIDKYLGIVTSKMIAGKFLGETQEREIDIPELQLWNGESFQKTSKILFQPQKDCMKVTTKRGYHLEGSTNHKIRVLDKENAKIIWKRYHQLGADDIICIARNDVPEWDTRRSQPLDSSEFIRSLNECYLVGLLIGDGHMGKQGYLITTEDQEIVDFVLPYSTGKVYKKQKTEAVALRLPNKYRNYLKDKYALQDSLSYEKEIPKEIWKSKSLLRRFLSGLFDTDGCWGKSKGNITFCSVSKKLAQDVHIALLSFGIIKMKRYKYLR